MARGYLGHPQNRWRWILGAPVWDLGGHSDYSFALQLNEVHVPDTLRLHNSGTGTLPEEP